MTVISSSAQHAFNSKDLINLARISSPVISLDGSRFVYTFWQYDKSNNTESRHLHMQQITTSSSIIHQPVQLTAMISGQSDDSPVWISDTLVAFTRSAQIHIVDIQTRHVQKLLNYPIPIANLKAHTKSGQLAFTAKVYSDGDINTAADKNRATAARFDTGVVYGIFKHPQNYTDQLFVRQWDHMVEPSITSQLFIVEYSISNDQRVFLSRPINLMINTILETPVAPHGDETHFTFSPDGLEIAFTSRLPSPDAAWNTNLNIYLVNTDGSTSTPVILSSDNLGQDSVPKYSPDGKYLSWLRMETTAYESDLNRIVLYDRHTGLTKVLTRDWDRSPESIAWSLDSRFICTSAQDYGTTKIFRVQVSDGAVTDLVKHGHNTQPLYIASNLILYMGASTTASPEIYSIDVTDTDKANHPLQQTRVNEKALSNIIFSKAETFSFPGSHNELVQGWFFKPTLYKTGQKYPLAFLMHGGPEGTSTILIPVHPLDSWNSDFSYRWNPQIWAGAGYAVVAINFHGSTGFGSNFTRFILNDWGGAPYNDLMAGLDFILDKHQFIDPTRVAALGASYGGYMANWINGHTNRFACIVNHDGIFDLRAFYYQTEELYFPEYEFKGPAYTAGSAHLYEKWTPALRVHKWTTPTLVIHSEKDYRIGMSEGLSTFTALQRQGIPSRLLYFPDECHWIMKPANLVRWYAELGIWLDKWTAINATADVLTWQKHRISLLTQHSNQPPMLLIQRENTKYK